MASYKVSPITCPLHLAKGPHWDASTETLYCVDIFKGTVHSYKPSTCQFSTATVGDGKNPMAVIVPVAGEKNNFLVSLKNDVATICWDGLSEKTSTPKIVAAAEPACNYNRLNNGKVDPCGRLWAGTTGRRLHPTELEFEEDVGSLYCFEKGGKVTQKLDKITISNGLEWSDDLRKFFYVDSYRCNVMSYDYDNETGNICNGQEIFKTKDNCVPGLLDAMTIDTAGRLYIANYVGAQVIVIDSHTGKLVDKIPIPAEEVTSCAFGGPNLDILYVTTGNTNPNPQLPIAGRIFQVTGLGAKGYAGRSVVLNDVKVEHVTDIPLKRGKGLSWNAHEQALFYADSASATIHSYKPSTKTFHSAAIAKGEESEFLLPIVGRKGNFLIGQKNAIASVKWDGIGSNTSKPEILATLQHEKKENTIISGKADLHGQIWIGTSSKCTTMRDFDTANGLGNVYAISNNGREVTKQLENVGYPNDFEWNANGREMYFIDSTKQHVEAFDLNPRTGLIASFDSRHIFNLADSETSGWMSALTIDRNEKLYIAVYSVGQVITVNPENGELLNRISIPDTEVVSCTFGGINMDILYVITCNSESESNLGKLFQVFNLGRQGYSAREALMDVSLRVEHLVGGLSQPRGIRWNRNSASLQFADSAKGTIHNFCPVSRTLSTAAIGIGSKLTGIILPVAGQKDLYAISVGMDVLIAKWIGDSSEISSPVILANFSNYEAFSNSGTNWICCGNVDSRGNLWAGTTGKHPDRLKDNSNHNVGHIYCVQKGLQVLKKIVDVSLPCGFEWSGDGRKFFYVDSFRFTIEVYDYNEDTGTLSSPEELFRLVDHKIPGLLGGMTMDTNEMLYVANYFGGQVLVVDSITGKLMRTIKIPTSEVISCTFGGLSMDTLYVVTGRSESVAKHSGSIYHVTNLGARGYPPRTIVMENSLRTEPVTPALTYGKGCFWDQDEQLLYFSDPFKGTIHSYNPSTDKFVTAKVVGGKFNTNIIIPLKGLRNKFLLGLDNELCVVHWDGRSPETSAPEKSIFIDNKLGIRFNTGKIDSRGRLWAGTTSTESSDLILQSGEGTLYCLDRFRIVEKFTAVAKVSGLEWSSDHKRMFLIDTVKSRVESYDYDVKTSSVSNGKVIYKLAELKRGLLYSMTMDLNDTLYICNNHGCQILLIDSVSGKLLRTLSVPAMEILSCAFGGPSMDTLYVTTGNSNPSSVFPNAGRVFAITNLGVRGVPSTKFIIEESIRAEPVTNSFTLATSPHWDADKQLLYFVAKQGATPMICCYSAKTSKCYSAIVGNGTHTPAMLIPVASEKDSFLVSIKNQLAIVRWDGEGRRTSDPCFIADCGKSPTTKTLCVGKVDPQGRLWSGTTSNRFPFGEEEAKVEESLQGEGKTESVKEDYGTAAFSNGLEWSVDSKKFFYVDSAKFELDSFDFDPPSGLISNRKCVIKLKDYNLAGSLDAMTIDIDGNLYIANNMGSQILVADPETGTLLSKIAIPAAEVTGCAFGGANLDILYVTTGHSSTDSRPHAGKVFQVRNLGVCGLPGRSVNL